MEIRAPYVVVGAFVLSAIVAVFGFVYWLDNVGGIGKRESYQLVFTDPVPGLLVGAGVLFNGIRVGEVTALAIVAYREEHGGFKDVEELLEVSGIGPAKLAQLKDQVQL